MSAMEMVGVFGLIVAIASFIGEKLVVVVREMVSEI